MNVLVTGAGGFIGRHVARQLIQAGHDVYALTRQSCDLDDPAQVRNAVESIKPEVAIHLAWYVEPGRWMDDVRQNLMSLEATVRLLYLLFDQGCGRVVLAGSGIEALEHESTYAASKRAVHRVAEHLATRGQGVVCAHLFNVFGPGEDERRVVPIAVKALLRRQPVDLTDGRQRRDCLYVEDAAAALIAIAGSDLTGTVDVATGESIELRELLLAMAEHGGDPEFLRFGARPYGPGELTSYVGDPSQLRTLGWAPAYDLPRAAAETVTWWRGQSANDR